MIKGIELFYQRIADSMIDAIPEEWSTASLEAAFFPTITSFHAEYIRKGDGTIIGFEPASDGIRAFKELRKRFKTAGRRPWGRARFELRENGSFHMKWGYENCDRAGYAIPDDETAGHQRLDANPDEQSQG